MGVGERGERCADRAEPGGLECSCRLVSRALALGLDEIRAHGAGRCVSGEGQAWLWGRSGGSDWGRLVGQAEVHEDLLDDRSVLDEGDELSPAAAEVTSQGVDPEHSEEKLRPWVVPGVFAALPRLLLRIRVVY